MSIRMGLIGAGRMGKVFAHTLAFTVAEADLVAVADVDPKTSADVAASAPRCWDRKAAC